MTAPSPKTPSDARRAFAEMARRPDEHIDLAHAALLIAAEEYPDLAPAAYLARLDRLAAKVRDGLFPDAGPHETLARLNRVLYDEEGFRGNAEEYYDPRNSYLNEVLDRRKGIPITLAAVYMEVARRVDFLVEGVGFPGHFLVKHRDADGAELVIDPFDRGRLLDRDDLQARLDRASGGRVRFDPELLRTAPPKRILFRMLNNLKGIYVRRRDFPRALAAVERMLLLAPEAAPEVRDRGILLSQLGRPIEAIAELSRYRRLAPNAKDAERIDGIVGRLRLRVGMAN